MSGKFAWATVSAAPVVLISGHSMLDWPEQTQTSPMRMFLKDRVLVPVIVRTSDAPDLNGPIRVCQFPLASAIVVVLAFANSTVIDSCGSAQPQILTFFPACRTMLSPIKDGTLTLAKAG